MGESADGDRTRLDKSYRMKIPEGAVLEIAVAVPIETKVFEFDFQDIELP